MAKYELLFAIAITCLVASINCDDKYYTCPNNASAEIIVYSTNRMLCPKGMVCNHNYVETAGGNSGGTPKTIPEPCLPPAAVCSYDCKDDTHVKVNNVELQCPDNYQCNAKKDSCTMCIPKPCDKNEYTCKPNDPTTVVLKNGLEVKCPANTVCNKDYVFPCALCIAKTLMAYPNYLLV